MGWEEALGGLERWLRSSGGHIHWARNHTGRPRVRISSRSGLDPFGIRNGDRLENSDVRSHRPGVAVAVAVAMAMARGRTGRQNGRRWGHGAERGALRRWERRTDRATLRRWEHRTGRAAQGWLGVAEGASFD